MTVAEKNNSQAEKSLQDMWHESFSRNKVAFIKGGKPYFDLLIHLIQSAKESIHLQVYIFEDDETGSIVADALKDAAKRHVQVYLLTDGYASQHLNKKFIRELKEAGVHFRFFEPFYKSTHYYFGRRMHHKIFVADARHALTGGINIANRYNDVNEKTSWLDFALYIEGEVAKELCILCWKTWNNFSPQAAAITCEKNNTALTFGNTEFCNVRMRRNDWVRRKNEISSSYIEIFKTARSCINIMCSYFLPGKVIRRLLSHATQRGVKVRIIIAGPSDVKLAKYAERWMYDWHLRNNIELYEYQPTVLHAKIASCDGTWLTTGSYNINNISAYASIELNMDVESTTFVNAFDVMFEKIIATDCLKITLQNYLEHKNFIIQFLRWCSYQLIRIIFFAVTFYYKRTQ